MGIHQLTARRWYQSFQFITTMRHSHSRLPQILSTIPITPTIISIETQAISLTARYGQRQHTRNINIFLITMFLMHIISTKQALSELISLLFPYQRDSWFDFFAELFYSFHQFIEIFFFSIFHNFQKNLAFCTIHFQVKLKMIRLWMISHTVSLNTDNKQSKRWAAVERSHINSYLFTDQ